MKVKALLVVGQGFGEVSQGLCHAGHVGLGALGNREPCVPAPCSARDCQVGLGLVGGSRDLPLPILATFIVDDGCLMQRGNENTQRCRDGAQIRVILRHVEALACQHYYDFLISHCLVFLGCLGPFCCRFVAAFHNPTLQDRCQIPKYPESLKTTLLALPKVVTTYLKPRHKSHSSNHFA
ncbi:hypothetical protein LCGC14_1535980 [marine sediment metagenome]|uniref:Uncharacterized protein n=1 Tax=marine sediment metagenome TaxID=412755 RepID=A0A0F9IUJ8_9ZZZZ